MAGLQHGMHQPGFTHLVLSGEERRVINMHRNLERYLDLPEAERRRGYGDGPIEYSHTLTGQIGGQLAAGFVLTHLVEAPHQADATARYMPGYFATRAVKPPAVRPPAG